MKGAERHISSRLQIRAENGSLRKLQHVKGLIDFCSNDYLGFARSQELQRSINESLASITEHQIGATGSRLITGNHTFTEETEDYIAKFHQAESGLIFNSGYDANIGVLSSLAQKGDTIILDELIHASIIDGARLTHSNRYSFKHNDLLDLEAKLKAARGNVYVVVESIYSMDGDVSPLIEICTLCERYEANLIVDEAHALGIFGIHGCGLVQDLGLQDRIFARVVTFGKALGCHGAVVLGSKLLRDYLINFARSFIYTTAAPLHTIASIRCAYQLLAEHDHQQLIKGKISLYNNLILQTGLNTYPTPGPVQTLRYNDNKAAKNASTGLQKSGFDVRAILSPTVAEGTERLRICIHLFNTDEEITSLVKEIKKLKFQS
jgi:8-amino-7-oxononanoate synthase